MNYNVDDVIEIIKSIKNISRIVVKDNLIQHTSNADIGSLIIQIIYKEEA